MSASDTATLQRWQQDIREHWSAHHNQAAALHLKQRLAQLLAAMLQPVIADESPQSVQCFLALTASQPYHAAVKAFIERHQFASGVRLDALVNALVDDAQTDADLQRFVDRFIVDSRVLEASDARAEAMQPFMASLLDELWHTLHQPSGVRVLLENLMAHGDVNVAGRDINIVLQSYKGEIAPLKAYLADLRAEWSRPDLSRILPSYGHHQTEYTLQVHDLYAPLDAWRGSQYQQAQDDHLTELRFRAVNKELADYRRPVLELIAAHSHLVITGAAGTGKSYLARFIAICLAYASDPDKHTRAEVDGLALLGESWLHGAILPLYVPMRNFVASEHFPADVDSARAGHLLAYIRSTARAFGGEIERYLTGGSEHTHGALLILDGLDEVDTDDARIRMQRVIENWADRFTRCRVLVTSRQYAYKQNARWRLSPRFHAAELAPFSRQQIKTYIRSWYKQAALTRPASFGGRENAGRFARELAADLCAVADDDENPLLPMMRQPLLLAMLTLIHETYHKLPEKQAELYEETIKLLNRWRDPAQEAGEQYASLKRLNPQRMLDALKLAAFDLQCKQPASFQQYPGSIKRHQLRHYLELQDRPGEGLGAPVDDVLDDLGKRNGVLLSDRTDFYRFPHLSIQEYMAASALIELYDECPMPAELTPKDDHWSFPENLMALLSSDPYRWRNVALFIGAIISGNKGQDGRWTLIEELLAVSLKPPVSEEAVFRTYIGAEIWAADWLKPRLPSHLLIQRRLVEALKTIHRDERLDAPERQRASAILHRLRRQPAGKA